MALPVIGITTAGPNGENRYFVRAEYVNAVRRAQGLPLLLPPQESWPEEALEELCERLDGLVLTGGGDVDPARYGGRMHPSVYGVNPVRDESEIALVRWAVTKGVPLLGICRGAQVINVALGGTLVEHLRAGASGLRHRSGKESVTHPVEVAPGSRLAAILGRTRVEPVSHHHQAVRRAAPGLHIVAQAPDGVIEGLEMPSHPFLIAVQWHPERTAAEDAAQQRLFDALVDAAKEAPAKAAAGA